MVSIIDHGLYDGSDVDERLTAQQRERLNDFAVDTGDVMLRCALTLAEAGIEEQMIDALSTAESLLRPVGDRRRIVSRQFDAFLGAVIAREFEVREGEPISWNAMTQLAPADIESAAERAIALLGASEDEVDDAWSPLFASLERGLRVREGFPTFAPIYHTALKCARLLSEARRCEATKP